MSAILSCKFAYYKIYAIILHKNNSSCLFEEIGLFITYKQKITYEEYEKYANLRKKCIIYLERKRMKHKKEKKKKKDFRTDFPFFRP